MLVCGSLPMLLHLSTLSSILISFSTAFVQPGARNPRSFALRSTCYEDLVKLPTIPYNDDTTILATLDSIASKALTKMQKMMHPDFLEKCDSELRALLQSCAESVHVADSSIPGAGRGLFASKDILAGSIVSFYPAHAIGMNFNDGSSRIIQGNDDDYDYRQSAYQVQLLGGKPLLGMDIQAEMYASPYIDVNPNLNVGPIWLSHFMNDGATVRENSQKSVLEYYEASLDAHNGDILPFGPAPIGVLVTTKDVKKGQEIFTPYGFSYWIGTIEDDQDKWVEKMGEVLDLEFTLLEYMQYASEYISEVYEEEERQLYKVFQSL